jgi:hypothetical protein
VKASVKNSCQLYEKCLTLDIPIRVE